MLPRTMYSRNADPLVPVYHFIHIYKQEFNVVMDTGVIRLQIGP